PKLCLEISLHPDAAAMRRLKQIGVNHVVTYASSIPLKEDELRSFRETLQSGGLTQSHMLIADFPNTLYGRPGRDEEIEKVRQSIRVAGRVGLPVLEYTF